MNLEATRFPYTGSSALDLLALGMKLLLSATESREGAFQKDLFPAFSKTREGQGALLAQEACQVTAIQSNQYAIVRYLGTACPCPESSQTHHVFITLTNQDQAYKSLTYFLHEQRVQLISHSKYFFHWTNQPVCKRK